jgi:hypothetical protein
MNKTFLLTAVESYTEGCMVLVIDSLDDFIAKFKEYHGKKREFMLTNVPEFYDKSLVHDRIQWSEISDKRDILVSQFLDENNNKPFNFEFFTGCSYIKEGRGAGNFYDDVKITTDPTEDGCWLVVKEFLSDLPTGTHYCGDYCA